MTSPIQRTQNVFIDQMGASISPLPTRSPSPIRDEMHIRAGNQRSFLGSLWDSIAHCFKSLFRCFFGQSEFADQKARIQYAAETNHFIEFYKKEENALTAFLGNFHLCPVQLWGMRFQCSEAAFQAAKFSPNRAIMQRFQHAASGEEAFRLGREFSRNYPPIAWQARSLNVMREVVHAKFSQNPQLKELLLATGNAYLVEHIPVTGRDAFWGDNHDGTGRNWLGQILMETRARLGGAPPVPRNAQYNDFIAGLGP